MGLYSTREAAQQLQVSEERIRSLCRDGKLDAVRVGRGWLIQLGQPPKSNRATSGRDVMRSKGRSV